MPNGREHLNYDDFGKHDYATEGTSDCSFKCGCWMGPARSGGPAGIDPFGKCPNNPIRNVHSFGDRLLNEDERRDDLINSRIRELEANVFKLKPLKKLIEKAKESSTIDLLLRLGKLDEKNRSMAKEIARIKTKLFKIAEEI